VVEKSGVTIEPLTNERDSAQDLSIVTSKNVDQLDPSLEIAKLSHLDPAFDS